MGAVTQTASIKASDPVRGATSGSPGAGPFTTFLCGGPPTHDLPSFSQSAPIRMLLRISYSQNGQQIVKQHQVSPPRAHGFCFAFPFD
jgi:hypothetical protein